MTRRRTRQSQTACEGCLAFVTVVPQLKLVQAWIEIHKEDLMVDWELAVQGDEPFRIPPLQ